ncbi:hypothetical protein [Streptomyces sp. URMC 129]|uniref:hypothetical protein n=1 Tax=Streptomyces sp. URMC 129 TaxID=3423407 RepID=UPI003F1D288B
MSYEETTDEEFLRVLQGVVAEQPDRVYERPGLMESCLYLHGDEPGCLIGHVLLRLGVHADKVRAREGDAAGDVMRDLLPLVSPDLRSDMDCVQQWQDGGTPWGQALEWILGGEG